MKTNKEIENERATNTNPSQPFNATKGMQTLAEETKSKMLSKTKMTPDGQEGSDEQLEYGSVDEGNSPKSALTTEERAIAADKEARSAAAIEKDFALAEVPEAKTVSDELGSGAPHKKPDAVSGRLHH